MVHLKGNRTKSYLAKTSMTITGRYLGRGLDVPWTSRRAAQIPHVAFENKTEE